MSSSRGTSRYALAEFNDDPERFDEFYYDIEQLAEELDAVNVLNNVENPWLRDRRRVRVEIDYDPSIHPEDFTCAPIVLKKEKKKTFLKKRRVWHKKEAKMFAAIAKAAKGDTKTLMMSVKQGDLRAAITALRAKYDKQTITSRLKMIKRFINMRKSTDQTLSNFIIEFKDLRRKLSALTPPVPVCEDESTQVVILIDALSEHDEYKEFVTNALLKDDLKIEQAIESATDFADIQINTEEVKAKVDALSVQHQHEHEETRKCFECNEIGHIARNCPTRKRKRGEGKGKGKGKGRRWPKKQKQQQQQKKKVFGFLVQTKRSKRAKKRRVKALAAAVPQGGFALNLDSAASKHCINTKSLLSNMSSSTDIVVVAQGTEVQTDTKASLHGLFQSKSHGEVEGKSDSDAALYTPSFPHSLLSAIQIVKAGGVAHLEKGNCYVCPGTDRSMRLKVDMTEDEFLVYVKPVAGNNSNSTSDSSGNGNSNKKQKLSLDGVSDSDDSGSDSDVAD